MGQHTAAGARLTCGGLLELQEEGMQRLVLRLQSGRAAVDFRVCLGEQSCLERGHAADNLQSPCQHVLSSRTEPSDVLERRTTGTHASEPTSARGASSWSIEAPRPLRRAVRAVFTSETALAAVCVWLSAEAKTPQPNTHLPRRQPEDQPSNRVSGEQQIFLELKISPGLRLITRNVEKNSRAHHCRVDYNACSAS